jgi:hypothetical protein
VYRQSPYLFSAPDADGKFFVSGPGLVFTSSSGYLYKETRFSNAHDAEAARLCCNEAYKEGYDKALSDVRKVLGFNS